MLLGLYSGIGWSVLGKLPGLGARFGTYELLTAFYKGTAWFQKFIAQDGLPYRIILSVHLFAVMNKQYTHLSI